MCSDMEKEQFTELYLFEFSLKVLRVIIIEISILNFNLINLSYYPIISRGSINLSYICSTFRRLISFTPNSIYLAV